MLRPVNKHKIQWLKDSGFKTTQTDLKFLGEKINNIFLKSDLVLATFKGLNKQKVVTCLNYACMKWIGQ